MPVELTWHPSLPVLQATYTGVLKANEYTAMCDKREKLLAGGPDYTILVVNTQDFDTIADPPPPYRPNILKHERVYCTLIVLQETLYTNLARTFRVASESPYPVRFFRSLDAALQHAESLAQQMN
jgi:hypothetical protein